METLSYLGGEHKNLSVDLISVPQTMLRSLDLLWFVILGQTNTSGHCCIFQPRIGITEVYMNEDRLASSWSQHRAGQNYQGSDKDLASESEQENCCRCKAALTCTGSCSVAPDSSQTL